MFLTFSFDRVYPTLDPNTVKFYLPYITVIYKRLFTYLCTYVLNCHSLILDNFSESYLVWVTEIYDT